MRPENELSVQNYSPHLFWDVDQKKFDLNLHKEFLVKRVLGYGLMNDWKRLNNDLGLGQITSIAQQVRNLDPKAMSFISLLSGVKIEDFRCYTFQQSNPPHWNF